MFSKEAAFFDCHAFSLQKLAARGLIKLKTNEKNKNIEQDFTSNYPWTMLNQTIKPSRIA